MGQLLTADATYVLLGEGGAIAGTFTLRRGAHRTRHVAFLGAFAMHPDHRGRGLGREAMERVLALVRSGGARRLELLVEADNARAIRFYENAGFTREGVLRGAFR